MEMQNDMTLIEGAYTLYSYGLDEAKQIFAEIGITGNIKQKVSQKRTKHRLFLAKMDSQQKKTAKTDYYELLADVGKVFGGGQLDHDMLLVEWIGILKVIKKENERKNREARPNSTRST